jgi:hypothetical protein
MATDDWISLVALILLTIILSVTVSVVFIKLTSKI